MEHPFAAPFAKTRRAKKHLAELEAEVGAYLASNPAKFETLPRRVGKGEIEIPFRLLIPPVPIEIGAIIGDVIHNLRTALDLTACEIVRIAGEDDDSVYFPFCKNEHELDQMIRTRHFDRAGPEAVELMRSLKPYPNGNTALRAVHDLDIHDKHRALIPNATAIGSPIIQLYEDDGTINPRVIGDPNMPSEVKLVFPGGMAVVGNKEIIPTLHELTQVIQSVIEAFRALANRHATV